MISAECIAIFLLCMGGSLYGSTSLAWAGSGLSQLSLPVQFPNLNDRMKGATPRPFASEPTWLLGAMALLLSLRRQFIVLIITTWCFIDEIAVFNIQVAATVFEVPN